MKKPLAVSTVDSRTAWRGRNLKLVLLGRRHRNGTLFTETWPIEVDDITGPVSIADLIRECLSVVEDKTEIPADLIEGVEMRFIKDNA